MTLGLVALSTICQKHKFWAQLWRDLTAAAAAAARATGSKTLVWEQPSCFNKLLADSDECERLIAIAFVYMLLNPWEPYSRCKKTEINVFRLEVILA